MNIRQTHKQDHPQLIALWEDSVRATHHFLPEKMITTLKPLILEQYFDAVTLYCSVDENDTITGFIGIANANIEMLFIAPAHFRKGLGKQLCQYVIAHHHVNNVDVNEQNPNAVSFYQALGFNIIGRSEKDDQGNDFPLLHLNRP